MIPSSYAPIPEGVKFGGWPVLYPSQMLGGEAQRVDEEQEERRECKGEGWTEDAPAARRTHMSTRPGDEAVRRLTGWG